MSFRQGQEKDWVNFKKWLKFSFNCLWASINQSMSIKPKIQCRRPNYVPSSVSLAGSFLLAMSFLIVYHILFTHAPFSHHILLTHAQSSLTHHKPMVLTDSRGAALGERPGRWLRGHGEGSSQHSAHSGAWASDQLWPLGHLAKWWPCHLDTWTRSLQDLWGWVKALLMICWWCDDQVLFRARPRPQLQLVLWRTLVSPRPHSGVQAT